MKYSHEIINSMDIEPEEKAELRNIVDELNRYIARAEALEMAIAENDGKYFSLCSLCIHFGDMKRWQAENEGCILCNANGKDQYVFDQQRFGGAT